jgi:hypothetical protein
MTIIGFILMGIGGGLLHDVPFPRFIAALLLIVIGDTLIKAGMV